MKVKFFLPVVNDTSEVSKNTSDLPILLIHDACHSGFPKLDIVHQTTPEMVSSFYWMRTELFRY